MDVKAAEKIAKKTREEKLREQKIESEILKSLNAIQDPDQKFHALLARCVESERICRSSLLLQKQNAKTIEGLLSDKDNLIADRERILSTKSKLESLCRELQNQNKFIKEESLSKIKEEKERREQTQEKFQHSLNEIQLLMTENGEKNLKLEKDNLEMGQKFKHILAQYEEREKQMERINKQMELVTALNDAKLEKKNIESLAEKEAFLKQTAILEETISILKRQLTEAVGSEKALKGQVDLYSSKYGEFTKTFEGYKVDITKMSKNSKILEKELLQWKSKYEKSNATLLDLISEKTVRDEHITKTAKQLFHLQKLCRTLSSEKKAFYNKLVELNIEIPEVEIAATNESEVPPVIAEVKADKGSDKLEAMVKSQNELKKNLSQLQSQLTKLATAEDEAVPAAKKNKPKKSKKNAPVAEVLVAPAAEEVKVADAAEKLATPVQEKLLSPAEVELVKPAAVELVTLAGEKLETTIAEEPLVAAPEELATQKTH